MQCGMLCQFRLRGCRGRRELYKGNDFLAALRSLDRPPNHCRSHNRRMRVQNRFDFRRIDILAEANNQFFGSANDKKRSILLPGKVRVLNHPSALIAAAVSSGD